MAADRTAGGYDPVVYIDAGDARVFTVDLGPRDGRPIVAIGGWIGDWQLWLGPFARLSRRYRTIAFDHRGSGVTVAPVASIDFDRLVQDVGTVMDRLRIERAAIAAESAGGAVALEFALRAPERVDALVLVNPMTVPATADPDDDPFAVALRRDHEAALDGFTSACLPEPDSAATWHWGRHGILARATPDAALALLRARPAPGLVERAAAIACPVLVLAGELDVLVPPSGSRALAGAIPGARCSELAGAGHVPTLTRADEVAAAIEAFLG